MKRLLMLALFALTLVLPAAAAAQPPTQPQPPPPTQPSKPAAQDEFVPVNAPINPQDTIPAPRLVAIAYGFIWVMLFGYVWSVRSRLSKVEQEIEAVSRRVPERK